MVKKMDARTGTKIILATVIMLLVAFTGIIVIVGVTTTKYTEIVEVNNANLYNRGLKLYTNSSISSIIYVKDPLVSITLISELNNFDYENNSCYLQLTWDYRSGILSKFVKSDLKQIEML
jgi:hypothetical protein